MVISLMGHFTIRLIFANMLEIIDIEGYLKINILTRTSLDNLDDILNAVGLAGVPSQKGEPRGRLRSSEYKYYSLFSLFFMNSRIRLRLFSGEYEFYSLPVGNLAPIDSNIQHVDHEAFIRRIGHLFDENFKTFFRNNFDITHSQNEFNLFFETQEDVFRLIQEKLIDKVERLSPYEDPKLNKRFLDNLVLRAWREIFYTRPKLGELTTIRTKIEQFIQEKTEVLKLTFEGIIDPSTEEDFFVRLTRDELIKVGAIIWGTVEFSDGSSRISAQQISEYKFLNFDNNLEDLVSILEEIINRWGIEEGEDTGKVKIFPLEFFEGLGYQFLVPYRNADGNVYTHAMRARPWLWRSRDVPSYFEIDLSTNTGREDLRHILAILLANDYAFVIKDRNGEYNDGQMICAFNHNGFMDKNQIYSIEGDNDKVYRVSNYHMEINNQPEDFDVNAYNNDWRSHWNRLHPWYQADFNLYKRGM